MNAPASRAHVQSFAVQFDYPVVFTRGVFDPRNPALADVLTRRAADRRRVRVAFFADAGLQAAWPDLMERAAVYFRAHADRIETVGSPRVVPGGEPIKNDPRFVWKLAGELLRGGLDRHACVVVAGGGAVLDAVGFAAALPHRGLRLVRLPSTTLSQADSGVGVKNGVNRGAVKNALGVFAPPFGVVNDLDWLRTLSDADWMAGVAEAIKVAVIRDAAFFRELGALASDLRRRDDAAMERAVRRCAELHLDHIRTAGDPFEQGTARPLDFGHWSAHALESLSRNRVGHGAAVAFGIRLDTRYAWRRGWLDAAGAEAVTGLLDRCGFPKWHSALERRGRDGRPAVLEGIERFREHLGGRLALTFPRGIGWAFETDEVDPALVGRCLEELRQAARQ